MQDMSGIVVHSGDFERSENGNYSWKSFYLKVREKRMKEMINIDQVKKIKIDNEEIVGTDGVLSNKENIVRFTCKFKDGREFSGTTSFKLYTEITEDLFYYENPDLIQKRNLGCLLFVGIGIFPFIFSWLTLRKGHSISLRIFSFIWLSFMIWAVYSDYQTSDISLPIETPIKQEKELTNVEIFESSYGKIYNQLEPINEGNITYMVYNSGWIIPDGGSLLYDNDELLLINIGVLNNSNSNKTIPEFKLMDKYTIQYNSVYEGLLSKDFSKISLKNLNPNIERKGFILFDVPKNDYFLRVKYFDDNIEKNSNILISPIELNN